MKKIVVIIVAVLLITDASTFAAKNTITNKPKYTVTIVKQNGDTITFKTESGSVIDQQYLKEPSRQDFVFQGWEPHEATANSVNEDLTITAKWLSKAEFQAQQDSILWTNEIQPKVEELNTNLVFLKKQLYIAYGVTGLTLLFALILLVLFLKEKKKFRDKVLNLLSKEEGDRMQQFIGRITEKAKPNDAPPMSTYQPSKINEQDIIRLIDTHLEKKWVETQKQHEQQVEQQRFAQQNQPKTLYADSIVDGKFNKVSDQANEDTVFELFLKKETDRTAEFSIYEKAIPRVLKNADFIDGCDKQRINPTSVNLQVENGIASLQDNNKWQIAHKAKVKFV